jgi:hypothetical protein
MKEVRLIQFTNATHFDYGYEPDLHRWYVVENLNDSFEVDTEEDSFDLASIYIRVDNNRFRDVLNEDNDLEYNLLTVTVDDNSQLFLRR